MKKFYLLPLLLFLSMRLMAQLCSTLDFSYTTSESRCMATGSISVNVSGGSGNYNFKVIGPITPPTTSSNVITGLPAGYYSIIIKDLTLGCSIQKDSAFVSGSYSDPRFTLAKTDAGCPGNDGTISAVNLRFGRSPFNYTIISPSPSGVGQTSPTGNFSGLSAGEYFIRLTDSCGGIQVRRITIESYIWSFDAVTVNRVGCDSADAVIRLMDNKGNFNTSGTVFNGFTYGVILNPGDTTWFGSYMFRFFLGRKTNLTIVVKDNCGNIHATNWLMPSGARPSITNINPGNFSCTGFTATVSGAQNFTSPTYCLYDSLNNLISCNSASGIFANIPYGRYCIKITDACYDTTITSCFSAYHGIPSISAPVTISNKICSGFTATVTGQSNFTNPDYCLYTSANLPVSCNTTGIFTNVPYGSYCIKAHDGCIDTTITQCFTVVKPVPVLTAANLSGISCSSFNVSTSGSNLNNPYYCLYDSLGNIIACDSTGVFTGIGHGYYCIKAVSCGDTTNSICFSSVKPIPSLGSVVKSNKTCTGFTATVSGSNLTNPYYCLYDSLNNLVTCDSSGIFVNIPYGAYCIKMHDGCMDTTITRCFSKYQAIPSVNASMTQYNWSCTAFSAKVTGSNLNDPYYCLYDSLNNLVTCDSTGLFNNIPFGRYCVTIHDGCVDTTLKICQTFFPVRGFTISSAKTCALGISDVTVKFNNANPPFNIKAYHPNGTKVADTTTTSTAALIFKLAALAGGQYKIVGTDVCGNKDSSLITPNATAVTRSSTVQSKCPSGAYLNGAGDIMASATSNLYPLTPLIISKNGVHFIKNYSSYSSNIYTFSDLEPASYIVEYTMQNCTTKIDDTVTVNPYAYPTQGQSAIYQCDNNGFSLGADVRGGVTPYTYQIIGSNPDIPSIASQPQTSSVFNINTGTVYSLVRLRSLDACGNATLNDVSVLPLQNINITASSNCFYQNTTLSVDTVPNATYEWYKRTTTSDSLYLGSGLAYNMPFLLPEQAGQYICKTTVNSGCATRLSYFTLSGNCGYFVLPQAYKLLGRKEGSMNHLMWQGFRDYNVKSFTVERKTNQSDHFIALAAVPSDTKENFSYVDINPKEGNNVYRLKINFNDRFEYSNIVNLGSGASTILVYPNPVKDILHIMISSVKPSDYRIEMVGANGQLIYKNEIKNNTYSLLNYNRFNAPSGMYLIKVTDINTGIIEISKVLFE